MFLNVTYRLCKTMVLLSAFALSGCLIESEKAVLPAHDSKEISMVAGEYIACTGTKYEDLSITDNCNEFKLIRAKHGELVAVQTDDKGEKSYETFHTYLIEGNLYLLQIELIKGISKNHELIKFSNGNTKSSDEGESKFKVAYGFATHNKVENVWHFFVPMTNFNQKLKDDLGKIVQFEIAKDDSMQIKNPSIENLSEMMKVISKDASIEFFSAGRITPKR